MERGFPGFGRALPYSAAGAAADRLALTVFLALVVHLLVILGVTFSPEERERAEYRSIDVVLVQRRSRSPPDDTRHLAEAHQQGTDDSPEQLSPLTPSPPAPGSEVQATLEAAPAAPPGGAHMEESKEVAPSPSPPPPPLSQTTVSRDHTTPERAPEPAPGWSPRSSNPRAS